jgi:acyl-CoA thioester hydrolase
MNSLVKVIPLRWNDFDVLGHVNNVRYFEFMQDARVALIERMNLSKEDLAEIGHVVAHQEIDYLKAIPMSATSVSVQVFVEKLGGASYDLSYVISDGADLVYAKASTVMVTFDVKSDSVVRIPDDIRSALESFTK